MVKRPPRPRPPRSENSRTSRGNRAAPQRQISRRQAVLPKESEDIVGVKREAEQSDVTLETSVKSQDHQVVSEGNAGRVERQPVYKTTISKISGWLGKIRQESHSSVEPVVGETEGKEIPEESQTVEISTSIDRLDPVPDSVPETKGSVRLTWLLGSRRSKGNLPSADSAATTVSLQPLLQEKQKAKRRRLWVTIGVSVFSILIVVAIALSLFVLPVFTLKSSGIKVVGVEGEQQEKIVADSQSFVGKPILGFWKSKLKSVLLKNEWVKNAEISRHFPSSVTVQVYPRVPVLAVQRGSKLVAYDEDATELSFADAKQLKLPIVEVKAEGEDFKRSILNTDAVMSELPQDLRDKVKQYTALSPTNIQFTLNNGAVVKWGAREDSKLKVRVLKVLLQVPAKVYDVTSPTAPVTS